MPADPTPLVVLAVLAWAMAIVVCLVLLNK
jgi:hypothetical protein